LCFFFFSIISVITLKLKLVFDMKLEHLAIHLTAW
jgi:hypothetical protein